MTRVVVFAMLMGLVSGCATEEVLGRVSAVEAPDTVQVGQPFAVTVTTTGPDGCWRKERTEASVRGLTATISPFDVDTQGYGVACTQAVVEIIHTAELTFAEAGAGVISVRGRDGTDRDLGIVVE